VTSDPPPLSSRTSAELEQVIAAAQLSLAEQRPVRCDLPRDGRLLIERPLPHFLIHRRTTQNSDNATERLITPLPPYLIAGHGTSDAALATLVAGVLAVLTAHCAQVLVIELSELHGGRARASETDDGDLPAPRFHIVTLDDPRHAEVVAELVRRVAPIVVAGRQSTVEVDAVARDELPFVPRRFLAKPPLAERCLWMRLEVLPIYRGPSRAQHYPRVLAELQYQLYAALLDALHGFAHAAPREAPPPHVGRITLEHAAKEVDDALVDLCSRFAFLRNLTPSNLSSAWRTFREQRFAREPCFEYRPLTVDPLELKRLLFAAPFELVEDPIVARLLRDLVEEYDTLLGMLDLRGSRDFLRASTRIFGTPDDPLVDLARSLLESYVVVAARPSGQVDALELLARARARLDHYRTIDPSFPGRVEMRNDVAAGIMVERGRVLIHEQLVVSELRAEALLAHEIDTHVVTFHNGRHQPLRVMGSGLARYEATQEGLAVLAEYLVGGLTRQRMRVLAARVLAVRALVEGASFVEVFTSLHRHHDFSPRDAFDITVRVFRGGGLTKDALYLRGLGDVTQHLREHGDPLTLYTGKVALDQWAALEALIHRGLVRPPAIKPLWHERADVKTRLERLRQGSSLLELVSSRDSPPDSKRG
jgi:uncharacterized protein (TIGR02421 family)